MAIAGTLTVNVLARTRDFVRNMTMARTALGGFRQQAKLATTSIATFGGLFGVGGIGAISTAGVGLFLKTQAQVLDNLGKTADKLGTSTEALGFWRFAADRAGLSTNTLDMAFQRMVRRIGQAAQGFGEAKRTLEKFNLDAGMLSRLDPAEQFRVIGQHINGITNQNEKLAAAMSLFDSEGVGLVNLFASNLDDARRLYKDLALEIGRTDIDKVEAMNDEANAAALAFGRIGQSLLVSIAPSLREAAKGSQILAQNLRGIAPEGETAFEQVVREKRGAGAKPEVSPAGGFLKDVFESALPVFTERGRQRLLQGFGELVAPVAFQDPRGLNRRTQERQIARIETMRQFRDNPQSQEPLISLFSSPAERRARTEELLKQIADNTAVTGFQ